MTTTIASIGEGLRSLVGSLEDETTLHFVCRVERGSESDVQEYEASCVGAAGEALQAYVASRAAWLRGERLRRTRLYLFFGGPGGLKLGVGRGLLGGGLLFAKAADLTRAEHERRLARLGQLRDRVVARLGAVGIASRELKKIDGETPLSLTLSVSAPPYKLSWINFRTAPKVAQVTIIAAKIQITHNKANCQPLTRVSVAVSRLD